MSNHSKNETLKSNGVTIDYPLWAPPPSVVERHSDQLESDTNKPLKTTCYGNHIFFGAGGQSQPRWDFNQVEPLYYFNRPDDFDGHLGDLKLYPMEKKNHWQVWDGLSKFTQIGLMATATKYLIENDTTKSQIKGDLLNKVQKLTYEEILDDDLNSVPTQRFNLVPRYNGFYTLILNGADLDKLDELVKEKKYRDEYFRRLVRCYNKHIRVQKEFVESHGDKGWDELNKWYTWYLKKCYLTIKIEESPERAKKSMMVSNLYGRMWHYVQHFNNLTETSVPSNFTQVTTSLWEKTCNSVLEFHDETNLLNMLKYAEWAQGREKAGGKIAQDIINKAEKGFYKNNPELLVDILERTFEASELYNKYKLTKNPNLKCLFDFTGIGEAFPVLLSSHKNLSEDNFYKIVNELTMFFASRVVIDFNKKWNDKWTVIAKILSKDNNNITEDSKTNDVIEIIRDLRDAHKPNFVDELKKIRLKDSRVEKYNYNLKESDYRKAKMRRVEENKYKALVRLFENLINDNPIWTPNSGDLEHIFNVDIDKDVVNKLNMIDEDGEIHYLNYFDLSQRFSTTMMWNKSLNRGASKLYFEKVKSYSNTGGILQRTQKKLTKPTGRLKKIDNCLSEPFSTDLSMNKLDEWHDSYCELFAKLFYGDLK